MSVLLRPSYSSRVGFRLFSPVPFPISSVRTSTVNRPSGDGERWGEVARTSGSLLRLSLSMLWEIVGDLDPRWFGCDKLVNNGLHASVVTKGPSRYTEHQTSFRYGPWVPGRCTPRRTGSRNPWRYQKFYERFPDDQRKRSFPVSSVVA